MIKLFNPNKSGYKVEIRSKTINIHYPVLVKYLSHFEHFVQICKNIGRSDIKKIKKVYESDFKPN